jgi:hypothetical protein
MGRGKTQKDSIDADLQMASVIGKMVTNLSPERVDRLEEALWDKALGCVVLLDYAGKPPQNTRVLEMSVYDENGDPQKVRVYVAEPDGIMLRHLVEQNIGRPGSRTNREVEQVIQVMHAIPGWGEEDEEIKKIHEVKMIVEEDLEEVDPWKRGYS